MVAVSVLLFLFLGSGNPSFAQTDRGEGVRGAAGDPILAQEEVDEQGHDRQWWMDRIQEWKKRRGEAQQQLDRATEEIQGLPLFPPVPEREQRRAALREEIQTAKEQIQEADRMLNEQIPEEARKAGAPPGWFRK